MPPRAAPARQEEGGASLWGYARFAALAFFGSQLLSSVLNKVVGPPPSPAQAVYDPAASDAAGSSAPAENGAHGSALGPQGHVTPFWPQGASLDMYIYFTTSEDGQVDFDASEPAVVWRDLPYHPSASISLVKDLVLDVPASVRSNGSWWADVFLTNGHGSPDPADPSFNEADVYHSRKLLTRYYPKKKVRKEKKLIGSSKDEPAEEEEQPLTPEQLEQERKDTPIVSYWHQNLTLALLTSRPEFNLAAAPPEMREFIALEPSGRRTADGKQFYFPVVFPNDFWNLRNQLVEINSTTTTLPIRIALSEIAHWKFQLYSAMGAGLEKQASAAGGSGSEVDELKRMLIETNPWLLGTTILVSVLHLLFEFLAFTSDVSHWRKKDGDLTGVSVRTIASNVVVQVIIMLYLLDSSDETSWMILLSQGTSVAIEAWKITKVLDIKLLPAEPGAWLPYRVSFEDKKVLSESEKLTQEYDREAFRIVSYFAIPVLIGYAIYSVYYETHRSWYSYAVTTAAQAIYMFGFVQLIPPLLINYRLKSVAHIPIKAMVYKTLSTVVDDFFSFIITMPWLHRLACFRDDVVFLVLLYQMYIYRVDKTRVNEYGQGGVDPAELLLEQKHKGKEGGQEARESKKTK